jgi:hypothetical protein
MSLQSFQVIWNVTIKQPHTIVAVRKAHVWKDEFKLVVDDQVLLSELVGQFTLSGHKVVEIDGEPVEVIWKWGLLSGAPKSIILRYHGQILAEYPKGSGIVLNTNAGDADFATEMAKLSDGQVSLTQIRMLAAKASSEKQVRAGASWFYWIAGLSMVNSLVIWLGGGFSFLIGLAVMQIIDGFVHAVGAELGLEGNAIIMLIALLLDAGVAGVFVLFGYFARKKRKWSFVVGMVLYALDGVVFLLFGDILSFGFHLLALAGLYSGFRGLRQLQQVQDAKAVLSPS